MANGLRTSPPSQSARQANCDMKAVRALLFPAMTVWLTTRPSRTHVRGSSGFRCAGPFLSATERRMTQATMYRTLRGPTRRQASREQDRIRGAGVCLGACMVPVAAQRTCGGRPCIVVRPMIKVATWPLTEGATFPNRGVSTQRSRLICYGAVPAHGAICGHGALPAPSPCVSWAVEVGGAGWIPVIPVTNIRSRA